MSYQGDTGNDVVLTRTGLAPAPTLNGSGGKMEEIIETLKS